MVNRRDIQLADQKRRDSSLVSPYLKRPLRSVEEVEAERRTAEAAMAAPPPPPTPAAARTEKSKKKKGVFG